MQTSTGVELGLCRVQIRTRKYPGSHSALIPTGWSHVSLSLSLPNLLQG